MRTIIEQKPADLPLIVRIAGLPADAVSPFSSPLLRDLLEQLQSLEESSRQARNRVVDLLGAMIKGAPAARRRFLLSLKRDCFNARDLSRYPAHQQWGAIDEEVRSQVERIVLLVGQIQAVRSDFEFIYLAERRREIEHLLSFLGDLRFMRGIALSSTSLTENLPRLTGKAPETYGRRERRLVSSLLRYVSRSALKLSPFSSLTAIGLGALSPEGEEAMTRHFALQGPWGERSKVRLQRYRVEQLVSLLIEYPSFRARLRVAVNDTVEIVETERYRFLRGAFWELDPETPRLREGRPALVNVRLRGPLIHWLLENASSAPRTYQELLSDLQAALPGQPGDNLRETVDRLLEIGFLSFVWPWPTADSHPEKRLLEFLETLSEDMALTALSRDLQRLVALEESYGRSDNPLGSVTELRGLTRGLLRTAAPLARREPGIADDEDEFLLHEDVFFQSERPSQEVAILSRSQAREILETLRPLSRLSNVESLRFDFLHSLEAFASRHWPGQEKVPFLSLFERAYSLFDTFIKHDVDVRLRGVSRQVAAFNPFRLDRIEALGQARRRIVPELSNCVTADGGEARLDLQALNQLLAVLSFPYSEPRDFCAFLQPLNDQGTDWVLNLLTEGIGRLSSRFTTNMEPSMQTSFIERFLRHSTWIDDGQEVELVDLFCSAGHSANVHVPYTRRVFELPGASAGLPPQRCLRLRDLAVRFSGGDHVPELVDGESRRILPVHLGAVGRSHMPSLVKFLALFGPAELRYRRPTLPPVKTGGVTTFARHRVENVVYRRKTWDFETSALREAMSGLTESAAFRVIDHWRSGLNLPDQVFLAEPMAVLPNVYTKPQYVDFTSPLLVEIFRSAIQKDIPRLRLTETLPGVGGHVPTGEGRRCAIELQLESHLHPVIVPFPLGERLCSLVV